MVVAVNGRFDLQNEDDYIAKHHNNETKNLFLPTPPTEPKQDSTHRPLRVRPKSSSDKKTKIETTNNRQRPKRYNE